MKSPGNLRGKLRSLLLGPASLPQAFDFPLRAPQEEIEVWLHGLGSPRNVTHSHSVACPVPFTVCIGFAEQAPLTLNPNQESVLRFCERAGKRKCLAEITLVHQAILPTYGPALHLYKAIACTHACLSPVRLWIQTLLAARARKRSQSQSLRVSPLDNRCNEVLFFCPRPVVLVSAQQGVTGNIFPMNLMGPVGGAYFVFALNTLKQPASLISLHATLALSTVPFEQAEQVRQLGRNHHQQSIDWQTLSFATQPSATLGLPVPDFAVTVRELHVEQKHSLGSHTFFITRILHTHVYANAPIFHRIHGLYAAYRNNNPLPEDYATQPANAGARSV